MVVINERTKECWEDLTQQKVAQLIHVNPRTITRWKSNTTKAVYYRGFKIYLYAKKI